MATLSGDDEASAAEDSTEERHLKFKCAYKQRFSSSTCETDSAAQSDRSDSNANPQSPEVKGNSVEEKDSDVYSELRRIRHELESQRQINTDMKGMMKDVLDECKKLSTLYTDIKFEMLSLKGEGKVPSAKYVKNKALMGSRRKTSPSSLTSFSVSGSNTEKPLDDL